MERNPRHLVPEVGKDSVSGGTEIRDPGTGTSDGWTGLGDRTGVHRSDFLVDLVLHVTAVVRVEPVRKVCPVTRDDVWWVVGSTEVGTDRSPSAGTPSTTSGIRRPPW